MPMDENETRIRILALEEAIYGLVRHLDRKNVGFVTGLGDDIDPSDGEVAAMARHILTKGL